MRKEMEDKKTQMEYLWDEKYTWNESFTQ
jgi:hypothetical protein